MAEKQAMRSKMDLAAMALAEGKSINDAAAAANVGTRTLYRWQKLAEFQAKTFDIRTAMMGAAVGRLAALTTNAAEALGQLVQGDNQQYKLAAARAILEMSGKLRENVEVAAELAKLRNDMNEMKRQRHERTNGTPRTGADEDAGSTLRFPQPRGAG